MPDRRDAKFLQVSCVRLGRTVSSISFSRKAASYFPRPRLRSQTTMSMRCPKLRVAASWSCAKRVSMTQPESQLCAPKSRHGLKIGGRLRVEFACSPSRSMAAVCAKGTAGVDVDGHCESRREASQLGKKAARRVERIVCCRKLVCTRCALIQVVPGDGALLLCP